MNVLFVHHGDILGGAPISLRQQLKEVIASGRIEPIVLCRSGLMRDYFSQLDGIEVRSFPRECKMLGKVLMRHTVPSNIRALLEVAIDLISAPWFLFSHYLIFKRSDVSVVHLNSACLIVPGIAARIARKRIVWHIREASVGPLIARAIRRLAHKVVCISPIEMTRMGGQNHRHISIIYNPIDFTLFDSARYSVSEAKEMLGIVEGVPVFISLGGAVPRKGCLEIVRALSQCPDAHLLVLGPAPDSDSRYHKKIKQATVESGSDRVHFLGIVDNPAPFLNASDGLVFAGMSPHFPRPVFEAWAMKKPVIVFDVAGISNNVVDGIDGLVVQSITPEALGEALCRLAGDGALCTELGKHGHEKAISLTDPTHSGASLEKLIFEAARE